MYNRAIILGRLTADPELKQTPSGVSVVSFSVAVDRRYSPKGGEKQVDFLAVVAWRQTAEFICRYFSKGNPILVEGEIQTRQYTDKQGNNHRVWEIIADNVSFTESKKRSSTTDTESLPSSGGSEDFTEVEDDGDLPF